MGGFVGECDDCVQRVNERREKNRTPSYMIFLAKDTSKINAENENMGEVGRVQEGRRGGVDLYLVNIILFFSPVVCSFFPYFWPSHTFHF